MAKIAMTARIVADRQIREQSQGAPAPSVGAFGAEQFLGLVDRDDDAGGCSVSPPASVRQAASTSSASNGRMRAGPGMDRCPQVGARTRRQDRCERAEQGRSRRSAPRAPAGSTAREELRVVAGEPGQQPGAQERGLARARGAEDHEQPRRRSRAQAAQPVDRLDDRRVAAEENAGIDGLERLQAAIGRPVRLRLGRPGEEVGSSPAFSSPRFSRRSPPWEGDVLFLVRARQRCAETAACPGRRSRSTTCQVPLSSGGRSSMVLRDRSTRRTASC